MVQRKLDPVTAANAAAIAALPNAATIATASAAALLLTPANKLATAAGGAITLPAVAPAGYGGGGASLTDAQIITDVTTALTNVGWGAAAIAIVVNKISRTDDCNVGAITANLDGSYDIQKSDGGGRRMTVTELRDVLKKLISRTTTNLT